MSQANLAKAIIAVMKEVKGMEKNSEVGKGTKAAYMGTKDKDVKEVFNDALARNGLCILPINYETSERIDRWEEVDPWSKETPKAMKTKQSVFTKVDAKYLLLHTSGESQEIVGYGHGVDSQDKGAGKATTYALKNCLLYTFLTPVGKIDDTDTTHSDEISTPKSNIEKIAKKYSKPPSDFITKEMTASLERGINGSEDPELLTKIIFDGYGIDDLGQLQKTKLNSVATLIRKHIGNENNGVKQNGTNAEATAV